MYRSLSTRGVFNRFHLLTELEKRATAAKAEIEGLDPDFLLGASDEDLIAFIIDKYDVEPPRLIWDEATELPITETSIDVSQDYRYSVFDRNKPRMVPASKFSVAVPVAGDVEMLGGQGNSYFPDIALESFIKDSEIHLSNVWVNPERRDIEAWWSQEKETVSQQVRTITSTIEGWRSSFRDRVVKFIQNRRARLLRDRGLQGSLGLRVRTRDAAPRPIPMRRKKVATTRSLKLDQDRPTSPFQPEPELEQQAYFEILDIIHSMGLAWERTPQVAQKYDEEELRDQILVQLNGHFEGEAGGELFNGSGKTDILIRHDNKNVFIGECKIWRGKQGLTAAIDQLASYMVWRDTKAAMILFVKQKDPSTAIERANQAVRDHPLYKRAGSSLVEASIYSVHMLRHRDDPQREIQLALMPIVIRP